MSREVRAPRFSGGGCTAPFHAGVCGAGAVLHVPRIASRACGVPQGLARAGRRRVVVPPFFILKVHRAGCSRDYADKNDFAVSHVCKIQVERRNKPMMRKAYFGVAFLVSLATIQPTAADKLFGVGFVGATGPLYTIDPATGVGTLVGYTGQPILGLAFAPDGTLFGADFGGAPPFLRSTQRRVRQRQLWV
jgi:hypothetical protein